MANNKCMDHLYSNKYESSFNNIYKVDIGELTISFSLCWATGYYSWACMVPTLTSWNNPLCKLILLLSSYISTMQTHYANIFSTIYNQMSFFKALSNDLYLYQIYYKMNTFKKSIKTTKNLESWFMSSFRPVKKTLN